MWTFKTLQTLWQDEAAHPGYASTDMALPDALPDYGTPAYNSGKDYGALGIAVPGVTVH